MWAEFPLYKSRLIWHIELHIKFIPKNSLPLLASSLIKYFSIIPTWQHVETTHYICSQCPNIEGRGDSHCCWHINYSKYTYMVEVKQWQTASLIRLVRFDYFFYQLSGINIYYNIKKASMQAAFCMESEKKFWPVQISNSINVHSFWSNPQRPTLILFMHAWWYSWTTTVDYEESHECKRKTLETFWSLGCVASIHSYMFPVNNMA